MAKIGNDFTIETKSGKVNVQAFDGEGNIRWKIERKGRVYKFETKETVRAFVKKNFKVIEGE